MESINLSIFTNILTMCKHLHWVTNSYAKHMALDQAFEDFTEKFDEYVEVALGIFGRDRASVTNIETHLVGDKDMVAYVSDEFLLLNNILIKITGEYSQLQSIFDEIKAIQNQLIYRLSMD